MALYNHLFARKHGGRWLLRIEDTDMVRLLLRTSVRHVDTTIRADMFQDLSKGFAGRWNGLAWTMTSVCTIIFFQSISLIVSQVRGGRDLIARISKQVVSSSVFVP